MSKPKALFGFKTVFILADKSQENLAKSVVEVCDRWQQKACKQRFNQETRKIEFKDYIIWDSFPDGFPNLFIKNVKEIAGKDIIFLASFHSVDVIFAQISLIYQIPRYLAHSCTLIMPYFPTGTMERIDNEGQIATAKTLTMLLSEIPPSARGPSQIMIFDIHALQERFYFKDSVIPRLESAIPLIVKTIEESIMKSNSTCVIVYPDDGAEKRFSRSFPENWPKVTFTKKRLGEKRFLELKEDNAAPVLKQSHCVIIDDLVQSGSTMLEAAKVLKCLGALSISAFVTHAVFPNQSWRKFVGTDNEITFENFWITDSIPHAVDIAKNKPFKLLSLAPLIADILLGFDLKLLA